MKSTRAERAAESPHDHIRVLDQPQLGRDVPYRDVDGRPVMDLNVRIESYGEYGLRREAQCPQCSRWLSYPMCNPCQSAVRLMGVDDRACQCFKDSLYLYGTCEHHRVFEQGPPWPLESR